MLGGRKVRSNKGKKRGPRSGKTRSGRKFRGGACGKKHSRGGGYGKDKLSGAPVNNLKGGDNCHKKRN